MGQSEIFEILKKNEGKVFTVKKVAIMLYGKNINSTNINTTSGGLRRLCKGGYGVRRDVPLTGGNRGARPLSYTYKKIK